VSVLEVAQANFVVWYNCTMTIKVYLSIIWAQNEMWNERS